MLFKLIAAPLLLCGIWGNAPLRSLEDLPMILLLLTDLVGLTGTPRRTCRSGLSLLLDVELEVAVVAVLVLQTVDFEETLLDDDLVLLIIIPRYKLFSNPTYV